MKKRHTSTYLARNLRIARHARNYTLKSLSERLNTELQGKVSYTWTTLREWEAGTCEPPLLIAFILSDILEVDIKTLIGYPECRKKDEEMEEHDEQKQMDT